jgi:hypothetical protein
MLGVDLVGFRRIWPAHVGGLVGPDGSRRIEKNRLDDHRDDQGAPDRKAARLVASPTVTLGVDRTDPSVGEIRQLIWSRCRRNENRPGPGLDEAAIVPQPYGGAKLPPGYKALRLDQFASGHIPEVTVEGADSPAGTTRSRRTSRPWRRRCSRYV